MVHFHYEMLKISGIDSLASFWLLLEDQKADDAFNALQIQPANVWVL